MKNKIYIFLYLFVFIIWNLTTIYYSHNVSNNPFYNISNKLNKFFWNKEIDNCKEIETSKYKYTKLYKKSPDYIKICDINSDVSWYVYNYTDWLGFIYLDDYIYNKLDLYNKNALYHELVHYNFVIYRLLHPFKKNKLDKELEKIYVLTRNICENNVNKELNFDEINFKAFLCKKYKHIKKFYKENSNKTKGEELIAYQTDFFNVSEKSVYYWFNPKKIKNKKLKNLFNYIDDINRNYIFKNHVFKKIK